MKDADRIARNIGYTFGVAGILMVIVFIVAVILIGTGHA